MIHNLSTFNVLFLSDKVKLTPTYANVTSNLTLTQQVRHNIRTRRTENQLTLTQTVQVDRSIVNLSVGNTLNLQQHGGSPPINVDGYNGFILWDQARVVEWERVVQSLGLTHQLLYSNSKSTKATLQLTQVVRFNIVKVVSISHTLTYNPSCSMFNTTLGASFILPVVTPTPNTLANVTFAFQNFSFGVHQPDFGNKETLEFSRINRRSRAGDLIIYRDSKWPDSRKLSLTFSWLTEDEKNKFKDLLKMSLGKTITYTDHFGDIWSCFVLNPQTDIAQTGRCQWQLTLELQGTKL